MANPRPAQFGGMQRFGAAARPGVVRPASSSMAGAGSPQVSRAQQLGLGLGLGKGVGGSGLGAKGSGLKRHTKIRRDTIFGVTKGDIRRLARRGGIKRISAMVYNDIRQALKDRLTSVLKTAIAVVEYSGRKTITVADVIYSLNHQGTPLYYGFDQSIGASRR
ncbi:histone-fold-containing protein [Plenodomus tracheiphilus IPT5]|uniref:Histone H4 n=1 Tax=Plenodomus tracheiphilus IPT5 TaxID=1408161 RepID=A0A6A7BJM1_9PLEO|nr:histone-fold-containing protein [Plenodomus tracheiphilus IPT5]